MNILERVNNDYRRLERLARREHLSTLRDAGPLPAYSSEFNGVERVWGWMRSHDLSDRVFADYDSLFEQEPGWLRLTATEWIRRAIKS